MERALLVDSSSLDDCGWCCSTSSVTVGSANIRVFPAVLSVCLGVILLFFLIRISVNYLRLHREVQNQHVLGNSSSTYQTFNHPPPSSAEDYLKQNPRHFEDKEEEYLHRPLGSFQSINNGIQSPDGPPPVYQLYSQVHLAKPKPKKFAIRWFHFLYLIVASGWFLLQSLVLLTSGNSPAVRLIDTLLYEGHAIIDSAIVIASFFPNDSGKSISISLLCTLCVVALSSTTAALYSLSGDCETCSFLFPAPEAFYTYTVFAIFYSVCLLLMYTRIPVRPRRTMTIWLWYLLSVYIISMVGSGLVLFGGIDGGYCIIDVVVIWYSIFYAPLLYFTLSKDSWELSMKLEPTKEIPLAAVSPLVARAHSLVQKHSVGWIPFEEIMIGERIGYGSAGEVYKGLFLQTPVAIKRLFDNKSQILEEFFREVTLMSKLSHPHVLLFMGVCVRDNGDRYIITEMMNKGSVFDLLHPNLSHAAIRSANQSNKVTPKRIQQILLQSARAMSYLHSLKPPILHRDLKSHNLLVDDHWNIKVADFGLSRQQSTKTMSAAGTPQWSAPEVIRQEKYTTAADIYSFGIIIFEVISKKIPYANMGPLTAARQVAYDNLRPRFPDGCDSVYVALAEECWQSDPEDRPTFPAIVAKMSNIPPPVLSRNYYNSR